MEFHFATPRCKNQPCNSFCYRRGGRWSRLGWTALRFVLVNRFAIGIFERRSIRRYIASGFNTIVNFILHRIGLSLTKIVMKSNWSPICKFAVEVAIEKPGINLMGGNGELIVSKILLRLRTPAPTKSEQ